MKMEWPELTIGICTYKRPQYAAFTLNVLNTWIHYDGKLKFHIADGGSPKEEIDTYLTILRDRTVTVEVTTNLADMVNSCVRFGGDYFIVMVDDYVLRHPLNINPDVHLLMEHPEIGDVRYSRMAFLGQNSADLIGMDGLHWWRLDKERSKDPYMATIGVNLYHKRFFEAYGLIPPCPPNIPGEGEINLTHNFNGHPGPTVAIPMRLGQDSQEHYEPWWHIGTYRTDEYAATAGRRL
jgi:hypothetical protein